MLRIRGCELSSLNGTSASPGPPQGTENVSYQTKGKKERKSQQVERRCEMLSSGHNMAVAFQRVAIEVICADQDQGSFQQEGGGALKPSPLAKQQWVIVGVAIFLWGCAPAPLDNTSPHEHLGSTNWTCGL